MTVKHTNDRLQYEFSEPLGDDYFDLTFLQGNEPVRSFHVYVAPELQRHVAPEAVASCLHNALNLHEVQGVPEPVRVAIGTPDGLVTMLVTFGDASAQPAQASCDWGGISKGLIRLHD